MKVLTLILALGLVEMGLASIAPTRAFAATTALVRADTQRMAGPALPPTYQQVGSFTSGSRVELQCHARGQAVQGFFSPWIPGRWDNLWYNVSDGYWVADVDIETGSNDPVVPACITAVARVDTQRMSGPALSPTYQQYGTYAKDSKLALTCYRRGQSVKGYYSPWIPGEWDDLWYRVTDGYWVPDVDIDTGSNGPITPACASVILVTAQLPPLPCGSAMVNGADWLGGGGVDARSNGNFMGSGYNSCAGDVPNGYGYQCVELPQRLYQSKGWYPNATFPVAIASQIWDQAPAMGMVRFGQGTLNSTNVLPGDMVIWGDGQWGHVAVVDTVTGSNISIVEQNGSLRGRRTLTMSAGSITNAGLVRGVVHSPKNQINPTQWYSVKNQNSGKVVDVLGGSTNNGSVLQQYSVNHSPAQQFRFVPTTGGAYRVVNRNDGTKVWEVGGARTANGSTLNIWSYYSLTHQQWLPESVGGGWLRFHPTHAPQVCMDVPRGSKLDSQILQVYKCNTTASQYFKLTPP